MRDIQTSKAQSSATFENDVPITFHIDDDEVTAHPPTEGQLALVMASMSDEGSPTMVSEVLSFFFGMFDEGDAAVLRERMRKGTLPMDSVSEIIEALIEEWSKRPTKSPSDSTPSRRRTGKSSTVKQPSGG